MRAGSHVYVCTQRPEGIKYPPLSLSAYSCEAGSLPEHVACTLMARLEAPVILRSLPHSELGLYM